MLALGCLSYKASPLVDIGPFSLVMISELVVTKALWVQVPLGPAPAVVVVFALVERTHLLLPVPVGSVPLILELVVVDS